MESSPVVTPVSPMVVPKKGLERMWESIVLTVAATAGNNIGKILQKKGTVILPPLSFKFKVIRAYALNKTWLIGFLMDIFGALLMLRALALAPVSIIQHVSGCGLAILSIFSHFYLKEVMNAADWVGITLVGFGTIVFMLIAHIWNGGGCCCCERVHIDVGGRESRPCGCHRAALESLNASAIGAAPFALPSLVKWVDLYSMANVMCL